MFDYVIADGNPDSLACEGSQRHLPFTNGSSLTLEWIGGMPGTSGVRCSEM